MKKLFKEFKDFISKGNVFDMAVGLIIATAFNKIVSSMVNDIIMPLVTWATGASSLDALSIVLKETVKDGEIVRLTWNYGKFLQTVIDFFIIAISVFVMVKLVNASRKKLKDLESEVASLTKKEIQEDKKTAKKIAKETGRDKTEVYNELVAKRQQEAQEKLDEENRIKAEKEAQEKLLNPSETDLLKEIRDLLKEK